MCHTDNMSVRWLKTHPHLSPRQARWLAKVEEYNIEIVHIPGRDNTAADALSRMPETIVAPFVRALPPRDWKAAYLADKALKDVVFDNNFAPVAPYTWFGLRFWLDDRIVVPQTLIVDVITAYHDSLTAGHWGVNKTLNVISRKYVHPGLMQLVKEHVKCCPV